MGITRHMQWQRRRMWEYDPRCHWCGVVTVLPKPGPPKGPPNPRLATIDHLRPRHHPGRREPTNGKEFRRVLACWKCNNERDRREHEAMPREKLWAMCGSVPLSMRPVEELKRVEGILTAKNPTRAADRRRIEKSLAEIRAAIDAKEVSPK